MTQKRFYRTVPRAARLAAVFATVAAGCATAEFTASMLEQLAARFPTRGFMAQPASLASGRAHGPLTGMLPWNARVAFAQEAAEAEAEVDPNAPKYEELTIPASYDERGKTPKELQDTRKKLIDLQRQVGAMISGATPITENQKLFDGFFQRILFPQFTLLDNIENPDNYNGLYQKRYVFFRDYMRKATGETRTYLLRITLAKMKEIANGNYHPAARVNAMLIISELNAEEVGQGSTPTPPKPYLEAFPVMVDSLADAQQPDAVKVAAMLGIVRHLQWDSRQRVPQNETGKKLEQADRDRANNLALATLNQKQPPAGRTVDGHAWMQRRAIDILTALGTIGTNVNATQTIDAMVADESALMSLRCSAAEALGQLNLPPETRLDPIVTAKKLGDLAVNICKREVKRHDDQKAFLDEKRKASGGATGGGMAGGMMPGMMPGGMMPGMMPGGGPGPGADEGVDGAGAAGAAGMAGMMPGMPGMGGMGGMPGMGGTSGKAASAPLDPRLVVMQRRLRYQMQAVKAGLAGVKDRTTGIAGIARDAKQKQAITLLADEVVKIRDLSEDTKLKTVDKFVAELKTHTTALEKLVKQVAAANPAAAAENVDAAEDDAGALPAMPKAGGGKNAAPKGAAAAPAAAPGAGAPPAAAPGGAAPPAAAPPAAAPPAAPAGKG